MTISPQTPLRRAALISITVITSLVFSSTASAQSDKPKFPLSLADLSAKAEARFNRVDANGDGLVELLEFEQAQAPRHRGGRDFRRKPGRQRAGLPNKPEQAAVQAELFALLDVDQDGSVSQEELANSDREVRRIAFKRALFKQLDSDNSGSLDLSEMPDPAERLAPFDTNGDGEISRQEMRQAKSQRAG